MRTILMLCLAAGLVAGVLGGIGNRLTSRKAAAPPVPTVQLVASAPTAIALGADRNGHFLADALVDGRSLRMMVDTGATTCSFAEEDAARLGIVVGPRDFTRPVMTANGTIRVAPVRISTIRIGPVTVRDVEAVIVPSGRLGTNLLGMSFLKRVRDFSIAGGTMTLRG
ncbi:TIGR02281 family clan AA aspartic protease [Methylobacterium sp. WL6]|jgi:aspartyl protease family protein|uniref:retropepsin-like aspartic protease family protein n=1 Tax=Methylobacterium sp. WL6 TaxID=2603901 RepID=UPI001FEDFEAC|nr:TIGR02281 family clan AA aspartic protease [Methylobacterium sp. WL6]